MNIDMNTDIIKQLRASAIAYGDEPLLISPDGLVINLVSGYVPLLVNFTVEDQAAKGLRKRKAGDKIEPAVYFSAVELVSNHKLLLLTGPSGSGKTTFAKHLAFGLATSTVPVPLIDTLPYYFPIDSPNTLRTLLEKILPEVVEKLQETKSESTLLIILDNIDKGGNNGSVLLAEIVTFVKSLDKVKLLLLGDASIIKQWVLSSDVVRHDFLPLSEAQRRQAISQLTEVVPLQVLIGIGVAAGTPAYFALALEASHRGDQVEGLLDAWLAVVAPEKDATDRLAAQAFTQHKKDLLQDSQETPVQLATPALVSCKAVWQLLAARHLVDLPLETTITLFHQNPLDSEPILRSLLVRLDALNRSLYESLMDGLIRGHGSQTQLGALLVSDFINESSKLKQQISMQMLDIIEEGILPAVQREKAGRVLSRFGDPRDLSGLANVPAGRFILGSNDYPNSKSPHSLSLEGFRIGRFPVVNQDFAIFVSETGRDWQSPDGFDQEKRNAPATDLTWYDAMAYCEWLTHRWRSSGKINPDEQVRLPSEPEWERAARGDQPTNNDGQIYPWGTEWQHDRSNYEETGLNARCSVGLFPRGCSPYGCYDITGQVWEWCTTLWGEDMATPSFQYPWRDDGREALDAPGSIRRVLRGGCFSSGRLKATCTYRGSLEPAGFWRGNGFRIVVAPISS